MIVVYNIKVMKVACLDSFYGYPCKAKNIPLPQEYALKINDAQLFIFIFLPYFEIYNCLHLMMKTKLSLTP